MTSREEIKIFINKLETNYPVHTWSIEGIEVWPLMRIELFLHLINKIRVEPKINATSVKLMAQTRQNSSKEKTKSMFDKLGLNKIFKGFKRNLKEPFARLKAKIQLSRWLKTLKKSEHLFIGSNSHRVDHLNSRYNRYFDVYIDQNNLVNDSIFLENEAFATENLYNKQIIRHFHQPLYAYLRIYKNKSVRGSHANFDKYQEFVEELRLEPHCTDILNYFYFDNFLKTFSKFYLTVQFFKEVLKKIEPKRVLILCYYGSNTFQLTCAANLLDIATIEMQHGPQNDVHLAYGSWSNIPRDGFKCLPKLFWCWDSNSARTIEKWTTKTHNTNVQVVGNFWVDYWKKNTRSFDLKNYILYSLQPNFSISEELFPSVIIEAIKESGKKWLLRIHPRQVSSKEQIIKFLHKKNVTDFVEIEIASTYPLPLLIQNCLIHVTNSSGTAIEAALLDKQTILIHEIGNLYHKELIQKEIAIYLNTKELDFAKKFKAILNKIG